MNSAYFARQIRVAKQLLGKRNQPTALDVGAGLGKCMLSLQHAGFDAFGFEPSVPFYERALAKMNIPPDKLRLGMVEEMDYPPNSFDFITFGAVFEHLYHPAAALEKALTWLKPDEIIHIEVPSSKHFISKIINFYFRLWGTNYVTHLSPMHAPYHLYEFGMESFVELGKRLNFSVVQSYYDVCSIVFVPKVFHPLLRLYMRRTDTGMQLTVYLRKNN